MQVSERMRDILSYEKLAGPVPRVLVLESQYWLDEACISAARRIGWEVETIPVVMQGCLPREGVERFLTSLAHFRPDFVLSVNLSGMDVQGLFARLFEDLRIPYVTWFVDDPRTILMGRTTFASSYAIALTWDEGYTDYLRGVGFPVVIYLPLAVDPGVFNAEPAESWDLPPMFIGNSMLDFAREQWDSLSRCPELAEAIRAALDGDRVTREAFAQGVEAILDPQLLSSVGPEEKRHAEMLFFIEGTRRLRVRIAKVLIPDGLEIRGDEDWKQVFPLAGGPVDYYDELPDLYRRCELNLNITSIQMSKAVNQRVFDCPAAGGFLLTDAQQALENLFDVDKEVAKYRSVEECVELFRWYRARPKVRREMVTRARKRILAEHTYRHRMEHIAAVVKEQFGSS